MKKHRLLILASSLLLAGSVQAQNPYLPLWEHVPDGEPRVFEDGPQQPLLSTNLNGYTMNNHYQVYGRVLQNSVLTASCSNKDVKIEVGKIIDGRATVKATWKGVTKVFLIN